nr:cache domain-containing protein [Nitrospirota bacterium]
MRCASGSWGLPWLILAMTAVAVAFGLVGLVSIQNQLVIATGESLALAAANVADKLDMLVAERSGDLQVLAHTLPDRMRHPSSLGSYLAQTKSAYAPVYLWIGVLDREGRVIAASAPDTVGTDYGKRAWFQEVRDSRTAHRGDVEPFATSRGGGDAVSFTAPLLGSDGAFLGAVSTRVALLTIEGIVSRTIAVVRDQQEITGRFEYQLLAG